MINGEHQCPRHGCQARVPDTRFACREDWFALPNEVRRKILTTQRQGLLTSKRRAAIEAAWMAWGDRS